VIVFADTSALVKLYVDEPGTEEMTRLAVQHRLAVSQLAWAEVFATFGRRLREGLDPLPTHEGLCEEFQSDWHHLTKVPLGQEVLRDVPSLCRRHPLRAGDALQLASAMLLTRAPVEVAFAATDRRLLAAAASEGLRTIAPGL
jgi:predicted nucleic acid-binding protein